MSEEPTEITTATNTTDTDKESTADPTMVVEEILVEGVSIDGMCGVY